MCAGGRARRNCYGATIFVVVIVGAFVRGAFVDAGRSFLFVGDASSSAATASRAGREADAVRHQ